MNLYPLFKPLLFALEPEKAHRLTVGGLRMAAKVPGFLSLERWMFTFQHPALHQNLWGLDFSNPVGLAAGFDKDGLVIDPMLAMGFGFVEVGTVTPRPQPGNPQPRLFRLREDQALINRMGFNNRGALQLSFRLQRRRARPGPLGVNLGKNLDTPLDNAAVDYLSSMHAVSSHCDYLVVNLSSPNTPGLRGLQEKTALAELIAILLRSRGKLQETSGKRLPLLIKIAPDLDEAALADIVDVVKETRVDGVIATNTTTSREGLKSRRRGQAGGLSGTPLRGEALRTMGLLRAMAGPKLPLVGVGGIGSPEDAYAMIRAGASLVQIYSALVYRGPGLVRSINRGLVRLLQRDGFTSVSEAVGADAPPKPRRIATPSPKKTPKTGPVDSPVENSASPGKSGKGGGAQTGKTSRSK